MSAFLQMTSFPAPMSEKSTSTFAMQIYFKVVVKWILEKGKTVGLKQQKAFLHSFGFS